MYNTDVIFYSTFCIVYASRACIVDPGIIYLFFYYCVCRYEHFCFLIQNHLSVIAYSSILFVYNMFIRILSTMYAYQHVCKTKRNTALLFAVVLISLSVSLPPYMFVYI